MEVKIQVVVRVAGRVAAAVRAAGAAASVPAPEGSASVRLAAIRRRTSRESPALK